MTSAKKRIWFNPFYPGIDKDKLTFGRFFRRLLGMVIGLVGFTGCLTIIYLSMRGIMKLGGFVATGGPYHIAHHAPKWFWVMPVAFFAGVIFLFFNQVNARRIGGFNLMIWLFPALFITLGYNFFDFALNPPGPQSTIAWGWLICGIIFALMGGLPLLFIIRNIFIILGRRNQPDPSIRAERPPHDVRESGNYISPKIVTFLVVIFNPASLGAGLYLAMTFFKMVSS